jgi:hypothetical protein
MTFGHPKHGRPLPTENQACAILLTDSLAEGKIRLRLTSGLVAASPHATRRVADGDGSFAPHQRLG